jgi:hypothetical protein
LPLFSDRFVVIAKQRLPVSATPFHKVRVQVLTKTLLCVALDTSCKAGTDFSTKSSMKAIANKGKVAIAPD